MIGDDGENNGDFSPACAWKISISNMRRERETGGVVQCKKGWGRELQCTLVEVCRRKSLLVKRSI